MKKIKSKAIRFRYYVLLIVLFAAVGTVMLVISKASTSTASIQPETATLTGNVSKVTDTTSSNANAVKFGVTSTSSPSGQAMPVGNLPGWTQVFTDDFTTNVPLGSFPSAVSNKWGAYPDGWQDTTKNGTYMPSKVMSIANGVMNMHLFTENGVHMVTAPNPRVNGSNTGQLYGRYVIRFKSDAIPGYKTAWMLWPDSYQWTDGEVDFPEADLTNVIKGYSHDINGAPRNNAWAMNTNVPMAGAWHTAVIEWTPTALRYILDGKSYQTTTLAAIPTKPMHWLLQTETMLTSTPPPDDANGNITIDWVAIYRYTP